MLSMLRMAGVVRITSQMQYTVMFAKVVEAYDAWLNFLRSWGWGKLDPELCMHVRARWSSFLPGLQHRRLCKFNMNITNISVSTFSIRDDSETSGHRISMTHLVIWIGPLCTLFLQRFYPLQSACQWLIKEAKKRVRQDADEAAWANSDSWSEAVDLLELLICFVPSLCKMSFDWSCWRLVRTLFQHILWLTSYLPIVRVHISSKVHFGCHGCNTYLCSQRELSDVAVRSVQRSRGGARFSNRMATKRDLKISNAEEDGRRTYDV